MSKIAAGAHVKAFSVLVILLVLLVSCVSALFGGPQEPNLNSLKSYAVTYCQMAVKDSLKAPRTAEFPWDMDAMQVASNEFAVLSYVDAQNSFSALIRNKFTCVVEHLPNDTWRLKTLTIF